MATDDFITQERKWQREQEERANRDRADRREEWTARIQVISASTAAVLCVAIVAALIWFWVEDNNDSGIQRENACTTAGGTWTTIGGSLDKVCVQIHSGDPR